MSIKLQIIDPETGITAKVVDGIEDNALVVATRDLKSFENSIEYFANDDYGVDMNINASTGGTPVKVHDGTDSALWTATDIVGGGKTTFNSTDQNHTTLGTKSIKVDNAPINDVYAIDKGSDLDCSGYVSITMWVYSDKDWKADDAIEMYGWDTGTASQVGDAVDISDYFNYDSYDVWQKLTIPLTDMGSLASYATLDQLRFKQTAKEGPKAPKYYLDDIQFEETGSPIAFSIEPANGTWLHVKEFTIAAVDARASTLADGTMANIPYDGFLGETLTSGITYQRIQEEEVKSSFTISDLIGLLELSGTSISGQGSDGTNTWVTIKAVHQEPLLLKAEDNDKIQWTVSEDLTGLIRFRITAGCKIEQRNKSITK